MEAGIRGYDFFFFFFFFFLNFFFFFFVGKVVRYNTALACFRDNPDLGLPLFGSDICGNSAAGRNYITFT